VKGRGCESGRTVIGTGRSSYAASLKVAFIVDREAVWRA
jgi:hypothetical protein